MASVNVGAELTEIQTELLGFSGLGGDKRLQLLPTRWPEDRLPPSSASLLAVASKRGLLAAGGPDYLSFFTTHKVHQAFGVSANKRGIIKSVEAEGTIPLAQLRQVAFSSNEEFLVVTAEKSGGLSIYATAQLLTGDTTPAAHISTDGVAVRSLLPNPSKDFEHYFAAVLDSGKLLVADVVAGKVNVFRQDGVSSAGWSLRGKAMVAGMADGTLFQHATDGSVTHAIPRPPEVQDTYAVSAVYWLSLNEFFIIHSPLPAPMEDEGVPDDNIYHFVKTDKERRTFTFQKNPSEICWPSFTAPKRMPPQSFSISRLTNWDPDLQNMLIVTSSVSTDIPLLTSVSASITPEQEVLNDYTKTDPVDNRRPQLPTTKNVALDDKFDDQDTPDNNDGDFEDTDCVSVGTALDLSSRIKVLRPIPTDEEINESPTPLPAYLTLTHQGHLLAWWIVYDKSLRAGTSYPGLVATSQDSAVTSKASTSPSAPAPQASQPKPAFAQPAATFGAPSTPKPGPIGFSGATAPAFGAPSLGSASATPFGKPSQPAFGTTSSIATTSGSGFGTGGFGNRQSPWGSASQSVAPSQQNPFASAASQPSGFAKFGQTTAPGGSTFSSFNSVGSAPSAPSPSPFGSKPSAFTSNTSAQSPFGSLGQQKGAAAAPSTFASKGLTAEPSFGSTVTVGSSLGGGSTLPSWANTPAGQSGSIFGQAGSSSFGSIKESDMSDADGRDRERDGETPTPQAPPPSQAQDLFGLNGSGFTLGSTFKGDGTAKGDEPGSVAASSGSLFGGDFASALGGSTTPAATPIKKEEKEPRLQDIAANPTPSTLFPSTSPAKTPHALAPRPPPQPSVVPDDAPLPPDPLTYKPPKLDEDIPPLAGSPPIKVEAPDSDVPSSPLSSAGDGISVEEQEDEEDEEGEEEEDEEPSPSDAARRSSRPPTKDIGWRLQDSVNHSPKIFPAAPTPPVVKSGASSRSGNRSTSPSRPSSRTGGFFGQATGQTPKLSAPSIFQQKATPSGTPTGFPRPPAGSLFQPSTNRTQDSLRSPSPVRSASTSALGPRRQQVFPPGNTPLSSSVSAQPMTPTSSVPAVSDLEDEQDTQTRAILSKPIEPTRSLDPFVAHTDYAGSVNKTGIPAQIELLFRDINSMVDTLGLNARSLSAFIRYHSEAKHTFLSREDLEQAESHGQDGSWTDSFSLVEIEELKRLEDNLEDELASGRIQGVVAKLTQIIKVGNEATKLYNKVNEVRRQLINRTDPDKKTELRNAQLPKDQMEAQKHLRKEYALLLSSLGKAEEATIILRSRLASLNAQNGRITDVPTVEAVKSTINKLILSTEKKNNDILILESQLRKLGLTSVSDSRPTSSSSRQLGTPLRSTRRDRSLQDGHASSPLATPETSRSKMSITELARTVNTPDPDETPTRPGTYGYYTPEGSVNGHIIGGIDLDALDVDSLRETAQQRRKVAKSLGDALLKRGIKVTEVAKVTVSCKARRPGAWAGALD